jgi:UDP-glucose 4-epimerase
MKDKILITGGSGFIGSNLVDFLLKNTSSKIICLDNLSTGKKIFLKDALKNKKFEFHKVDIRNYKNIFKYFKNVKTVFHFAALADVKNSSIERNQHFENNILATQNIIECCAHFKIKRLIFSSTGSVYGVTKNIPTKENNHFPIQNSYYAAAKLASEALITAFAESNDIKISILRFVSVLGNRYTHGHVYDFYFKLKRNKEKLKVLGNGLQNKSYIHIFDLLQAINTILRKQKNKIEIFNVGINETKKVKASVKIIVKFLKVKPKILYENKSSGWSGDIPNILLDCRKLKKLGWKNIFNIEESIIDTIKWIDNNLSTLNKFK